MTRLCIAILFCHHAQPRRTSDCIHLMRRYSKQQVYIVTATELLDLLPERKEAQERVKKLEKLQKILSEHERLEKQVI